MSGVFFFILRIGLVSLVTKAASEVGLDLKERYSQTCIKPVLSGHPSGIANPPLNTGVTRNTGLTGRERKSKREDF